MRPGVSDAGVPALPVTIIGRCCPGTSPGERPSPVVSAAALAARRPATTAAPADASTVTTASRQAHTRVDTRTGELRRPPLRAYSSNALTEQQLGRFNGTVKDSWNASAASRGRGQAAHPVDRLDPHRRRPARHARQPQPGGLCPIRARAGHLQARFRRPQAYEPTLSGAARAGSKSCQGHCCRGT